MSFVIQWWKQAAVVAREASEKNARLVESMVCYMHYTVLI